MDPKERIDRHSIPATFPYDEREEINQVREIDCVALVKLCASDLNNSAAWREFLCRYLNKIRDFVLRVSQSYRARHFSNFPVNPTPRPQDREDLSQEVLERLIANDGRLLKRFEGETEEALFRYLWVISNSVVIDHYRGLRNQQCLEHHRSLEELDPAVLDRIGLTRSDLKMEKSILMQEIAQIVEAFLQKEIAEAEIRDRYLLIFKLYAFDGLSTTEIARQDGVDISRQAIDKAIIKIIRYLREMIGISPIRTF